MSGASLGWGPKQRGISILADCPESSGHGPKQPAVASSIDPAGSGVVLGIPTSGYLQPEPGVILPVGKSVWHQSML